MPYIGHSPTQAGSFIQIDDFSSSFNGSTTAFTMQVGSVDVTPNVNNLLIIIDGVLQHEGDAFSISGSTITFTSAPASGASFYGVLMGQSASVGQGTVGADELKVSGNGSSGQVLTSDGDGTFSWATDTEDYLPLSGGTLEQAGDGSKTILTLHNQQGGLGDIGNEGTYLDFKITDSNTNNPNNPQARIGMFPKPNADSTALESSGELRFYTASGTGTNTNTLNEAMRIDSSKNTTLYGSLTGTSASFSGQITFGQWTSSTNVFKSNVSGDTGAYIRSAVSSTAYPTYSFHNDTNTGMYHVGTDSVGLVAGGSRKFYVNSTNAYFQNLSGGVEMPSLSITESGGNNATLKVNRGLDGGRIQFSYSGNSTGLGEIGQTYYGTGRTKIWMGANLESFSTGHLAPTRQDTGFSAWWTEWNSMDDNFKVVRNGSDKLTLNSSGNVGIDTDSPSHPLHVVTNSSDKGITLTADGSSNHIFTVMKDGSAGRLFLKSSNSVKVHLTAKSGEDSYINNGGSVGIGTSSPSYPLDVSGTIRALNGNLFLAGAYSVKNVNSNLLLDSASGTDVIIRPNNGVEAMRIDSSGNATFSGDGLFTNGILTVQDTHDATLWVRADTDNVSETDNATLRLSQDGDLVNFYIGTDSSNYCYFQAYSDFMWKNSSGSSRMLLTSTGILHTDSDVIAYSSSVSDVSLKEEITPITNALDVINQIDTIRYKYNYRDGYHYGIKAQQLQELIPEIVKETDLSFHTKKDGEDRKLTVRDKELIPFLIEAVKEQQKQIDTLKQEMN